MSENYIKFGTRTKLCIFILLALSLTTVNSIATSTAILFVPIAAKMLYRKNELPVLYPAIMLQWLQVTIKVFYADFYNVPLESVFEFPDHIYKAYYFSLLSLLAVSFGVWMILRKVPTVSPEDYTDAVQQFSSKKIVIIYILAIIIAPLLNRYAFAAGGLQQFIIKAVELKWTLFFIFFITAFLKNENKLTFYLIVLFEIILSFTGIFSSFKEYFMFLGIGYMMINPKLTTRKILVLTFIGTVLFNFFVVWQHVKPEYRHFLTNGENTQSVKVDNGAALEKLLQLVGEMDTAGYRDGVIRLLERTSYIDFFSASIAYVPKYHPYENGSLWLDALTRVFMPRFLFPNKAIIDDSQVTMKYTGLKLADASEGVSISLGYIGETYADVGLKLMLVPLFLFGLIIGLIYKHILTTTSNIIWRYGLILPLFFQLNVYEQALIKFVGGIIAYFIVIVIIRKSGFIDYLNKKISLPICRGENDNFKNQFMTRYNVVD